MHLLRTWGATDSITPSFACTAGRVGNIKAIDILEEWGSLVEADALVGSVEGPIENSDADKSLATIQAQLTRMAKVRARLPNANALEAFYAAAERDHSAALQLCLEWLGGVPPIPPRLTKLSPEIRALWNSWLGPKPAWGLRMYSWLASNFSENPEVQLVPKYEGKPALATPSD